MKAQETLLTLEEAARRLGMRTVTVRMWASQRKIDRCKINRSVRIPEREVERIIAETMVPRLDSVK
jgi:excisionase family DNA binding protein